MNIEEIMAQEQKPFQIIEGHFMYALALPSGINPEISRQKLEHEFKDCLRDLARDEGFGITNMFNCFEEKR